MRHAGSGNESVGIAKLVASILPVRHTEGTFTSLVYQVYRAPQKLGWLAACEFATVPRRFARPIL